MSGPGARPSRLLVPTVCLFAACATTGGLRNARGDGIARCYPVPLDVVWPKADSAARWVGLVFEDVDSTAHVILARNYEPDVQDPDEMALDADQGERVAIFVDPWPEGHTRVEVVSRPIFQFDPTPKDWTGPVFDELERRLALPDTGSSPPRCP